MQALPRLYKLWPWVDLDPFYAKVKFDYIGFCMGENENYLFFGNYCSLRSCMGENENNLFFGNYCCLRSQSCLNHSAKWVNEVEWVSKVKVIFWPWSKITQILKLNVWFWPVFSGERFRASGPSCLSPRDDSQGSLRFAPVCLSVRSSYFTVWSLCNQLLPQFSVGLFETLHTCCGHIEDVHMDFWWS